MPATLEEINALGRDAFVAALGHLFEHSPWVAAETHRRGPFADAGALHAALCATLMAAGRARQVELVRAHPDLAGRLASAGGLTDASAREQSAAGLDRLTQAEAEEMRGLNAAYRERFGFPFVICARLNARDAILASMRSRLGNTPEAELSTALGEIAKIAKLRLGEAVKPRQ
jgi:2-oxo-4-hydroxy-4-carboxy-5-ureidoimidazoline decarboxylase